MQPKLGSNAAQFAAEFADRLGPARSERAARDFYFEHGAQDSRIGGARPRPELRLGLPSRLWDCGQVQEDRAISQVAALASPGTPPSIVESRCDAVVIGLAYPLPALSDAGASLASP